MKSNLSGHLFRVGAWLYRAMLKGGWMCCKAWSRWEDVIRVIV